MFSFLKVIRHPGDEEIICPLTAEIGNDKCPEHRAFDGKLPWKCLIMHFKMAVFFDKCFFLLRNFFHLRRVISKPEVAYQYPDQSDQGIHKKRRTPTKCRGNGNNNKGSNRSTCGCAHRKTRYPPGSLAPRKPTAYHTCTVRICTCFAHAK